MSFFASQAVVPLPHLCESIHVLLCKSCALVCVRAFNVHVNTALIPLVAGLLDDGVEILICSGNLVLEEIYQCLPAERGFGVENGTTGDAEFEEID